MARQSLLAPLLRATAPPCERPQTAQARWSLGELTGRLTELCGDPGSVTLTLAFTLVKEAQQQGEPVAFIMDVQSSFFPPDVADGGVRLESLLTVRTSGAALMARAADQLARSGAFGLLVLDVGSDPVPQAQLSRLLGLAQKHAIAIVFLTGRTRESSSLGSLISLRAETYRGRSDNSDSDGEFVCELVVVKDKRRAPGWKHLEECRGPAGLR